jgi:hypothetical protein
LPVPVQLEPVEGHKRQSIVFEVSVGVVAEDLAERPYGRTLRVIGVLVVLDEGEQAVCQEDALNDIHGSEHVGISVSLGGKVCVNETADDADHVDTLVPEGVHAALVAHDQGTRQLLPVAAALPGFSQHQRLPNTVRTVQRHVVWQTLIATRLLRIVVAVLLFAHHVLPSLLHNLPHRGQNALSLLEVRVEFQLLLRFL